MGMDPTNPIVLTLEAKPRLETKRSNQDNLTFVEFGLCSFNTIPKRCHWLSTMATVCQLKTVDTNTPRRNHHQQIISPVPPSSQCPFSGSGALLSWGMAWDTNNLLLM